MKLIYLIGLLLSTHLIQQGKAVENATTTTKTSIQNKYAVTEDADENKKKIVIEKQSKAQSSWRAKYAPESVWTGSEAELTQDRKDYPLKCVWTKSKGLEVWRDSGRSLEEAEKCCIYIWFPGDRAKGKPTHQCVRVPRDVQTKTFHDARKYCRKQFGEDLATYRDMPELRWKLLGYMLPEGTQAWIGAHRNKTASPNGLDGLRWLTHTLKGPKDDVEVSFGRDVFEECNCGIKADQSQDFELGMFVKKVKPYDWKNMKRWWETHIANVNNNENKFAFACGEKEIE